MKVLIVLAAFIAAAAASDLICYFGETACKINCMSSGHLDGHCDENGECDCHKVENPQPRTEMVCMLGGDLACEVNCLVSTGHFAGKCDEENDCICEHKDHTTPQPEARTELVCMLGGQLACEVNCLMSTGHFAGKCDEENDCICEHKEHTTQQPTFEETRRRRGAPARGDLACRHGGDEVCAAFCHYTTGKQGGFCDAGDNCHCGPKP